MKMFYGLTLLSIGLMTASLAGCAATHDSNEAELDSQDKFKGEGHKERLRSHQSNLELLIKVASHNNRRPGCEHLTDIHTGTDVHDRKFARYEMSLPRIAAATAVIDTEGAPYRLSGFDRRNVNSFGCGPEPDPEPDNDETWCYSVEEPPGLLSDEYRSVKCQCVKDGSSYYWDNCVNVAL